MSRVNQFLWVLALIWLALPAIAQDLSGLARVDPDQSLLVDQGDETILDLHLSQGVPYRFFSLEDPDRLVIDFREADWDGLDAHAFNRSERVEAVRFGGFRPGWSRMVLDLSQPMKVRQSDMRIDRVNSAAHLRLHFAPVTREEFSRLSTKPDTPDWGVAAPSPPAVDADGRVVVVLDPGHGGIDPGAMRDGHTEKDLMLTFARELREALLRVDGIEVVLTRDSDVFVSLERRVAIAHQAGAHLFLSLHADALSEGQATGATVHTLSDQASDQASALLAERHNRADILAGIDLTGTDDTVADILMDLARVETQPRAEQLSEALIDALRSAGAPLNRRPYRSAAFSVLKAADIPSVLLEIGFMSSERDLTNVTDPEWRRQMAEALRDGIQAWIIMDASLRALVRQ
ncbi:MAG: N-acetylmuramoyl-L-alanine amidase [Rhodobacteraceae bacterium HLUCCO07]|nr:MAG: N-acetylmuramoyl-L-alanine amidase [Rhodobacteraceae bacterium HLUCCO07]